jgi:hypothetical protein
MKTKQGLKWRWVLAVAVVLEGCRPAIGQQPEPHATLKGHATGVNALAFSPDGRTLASADGHGTVRLWELRTSRQRAALEDYFEGVNVLAFSPDGKLLASAGDDGDDGVMTLWERASGKVRAWLKGHPAPVRSAAFVSGGDLLASGSTTGTIRLWDLRARKQRAVLKGHIALVFSLAGAGRLLASAGCDRRVRLWDTAVGKQLLVLKPDQPVEAVALSLDGRLFAAGDRKGTIFLWSVPKLLAQKREQEPTPRLKGMR